MLYIIFQFGGFEAAILENIPYTYIYSDFHKKNIIQRVAIILTASTIKLKIKWQFQNFYKNSYDVDSR